MWCRSCAGIAKLAGDSRLRIGLGFWRRWYCGDSEGKRFAALWGNGDYGRLGLGSLDSQWKPVVCSALDSLRAIACGGAHTLFLTESGRVYASGHNKFGQLGISDEDGYVVEPVEVPGFEKEVKQISAGYNHSCAVTEDGELYVWGRNSSGQLGLGKRAPKAVPKPTKVEHLAGMRIKMVALGSEHSIAVTDDGVALSWGSGTAGRLGHGHESSMLGFLRSNSEYIPRLIKELEGVKVKSVSAGLMHTACIDENGCVYIFGERALAKLGFGSSNNATTPLRLQEIPFCEDVACGGYHSCIITCGGELYTWGSNENGCLGIGYDAEVAHQPERVEGPFLRNSVSKVELQKVGISHGLSPESLEPGVSSATTSLSLGTGVSCGWKHTAAISRSNKSHISEQQDYQIYSWGWGGSYGTFASDGHSSAGQLGLGTDVDYVEPARVEFGRDVKVLDLSCGFNHTGAILELV